MAGLGILDDRLQGRLWHAPHPDRFLQVLDTGAIVAHPEIPRSKLWGGTPLVRALDGVSLFEFANFDVEEYELKYPSSSWGYFIPHHLNWGVAVWIEIDRQSIADTYRSPSSLLQQWKDEERQAQRIMPGIEAACLGNVPLAAFRSAFVTWDNGREVRDLSLAIADRQQLLQSIEEWRAHASQA
ncbi:hypothetical protein [Mesorhizobium humile]|uniref:Uncharacterized protein n=1 Tax=Mesorhizobium humile TaxID=3072313 RepID=A0ABU4YTE7_9HYPH|nr:MULTISPECIES: hypothetical protein [unclassified Mesorhizobium]MDX8462133.1 hypothetical protein [Mesorhizobium sp. VK2D]MDX8489623.1 hypothetical protein [Mesorhizobium sp. VK2B]